MTTKQPKAAEKPETFTYRQSVVPVEDLHGPASVNGDVLRAIADDWRNRDR